MIFIAIFLWWIIGFISVVYDITEEYTYDVSDILPTCLVACTGPLFLLWRIIEKWYVNNRETVLFKKRKYARDRKWGEDV